MDFTKDIKDITNPSDEYGDGKFVVAPIETVKMSASVKAGKKARRNLLNHAMAKSMLKGNFDSSIGLMSTKPEFPSMSSQL
jgi:hypothetical protein